MVKHFSVQLDLQGPHAPDMVGYIRELLAVGYSVMRAEIFEHADHVPAAKVDVLAEASKPEAKPVFKKDVGLSGLSALRAGSAVKGSLE